MVKNLPAVQETRVQSLGWEDPLEKGMATQLIRDQVKIFVPRNKRSFLYIFQHHITLYPSRYKYHYASEGASLVAQRLRRLTPMQETRVRALGWEDPLEKDMTTHSSILA